MANDRLYLVCNHCGEQTLFAEYYPPGGCCESYCWPVACASDERDDKFGEFVEKHMNECPQHGFTLKGDPVFRVVAESADPPLVEYLLQCKKCGHKPYPGYIHMLPCPECNKKDWEFMDPSETAQAEQEKE